MKIYYIEKDSDGDMRIMSKALRRDPKHDYRWRGFGKARVVIDIANNVARTMADDLVAQLNANQYSRVPKSDRAVLRAFVNA